MTQHKFLHFGVACIVVTTLSGCAAILGGSSNVPVRLLSDPPGAKVYNNGMLVGTTPAAIVVDKRKDQLFEFRKDGYTSATKLLPSSAGAGWIVCDVLLTGVVGIAVDAATQSWNNLDMDFVSVALESSKN